MIIKLIGKLIGKIFELSILAGCIFESPFFGYILTRSDEAVVGKILVNLDGETYSDIRTLMAEQGYQIGYFKLFYLLKEQIRGGYVKRRHSPYFRMLKIQPEWRFYCRDANKKSKRSKKTFTNKKPKNRLNHGKNFR